jgi:hypothetical protein
MDLSPLLASHGGHGGTRLGSGWRETCLGHGAARPGRGVQHPFPAPEITLLVICAGAYNNSVSTFTPLLVSTIGIGRSTPGG